MYIKDISHFPIQFAVDIILLLLPSSLVYTLQIVVSELGFLCDICAKDCVPFFAKKFDIIATDIKTYQTYHRSIFLA